nr:MAG TPA: tail assembly chaperone [Caudoviricetes sp.]DAF75172.1 MAG TPA: tail assembly chaperone [Caudoviricetes sp.]
MSVKPFTIGGAQYNAAMASAVDQDRLMSLLSGAVLERFATAAQAGIEVDDQVLCSMFMSMRQDVKAQVVQILMTRVFINGTERSITVADFGGKMVHYNQLLAELLRWNLSDFFDWLPSGEKGARQPGAESAAQ